MTHDYRVTVKDGARRATYDEHASRLPVAVSRALDKHERAHGKARALMVEAQDLGVHKRGPCGRGCRTYIDEARAYCANPCNALERHTSLHRCDQHRAESIRA